MSKKKRRTTKKQANATAIFVCVVVMVLLAACYSQVSNLCEKSRELSETEYALEQKIENAYLEREELVAREQYMQTKQYIEDVAKEKLGMVYPDEIVIRPSE